jgi:hypothetical protein
MTLSVLSTLARLGKDPWQEAGRLALMPKTAAGDALARMITATPTSVWSLSDAMAIAVRLVALLPNPNAPSSPGGGATSNATSWTRKQWVVLFVVATLATGLTQALMSHLRMPSDSSIPASLLTDRPVSPPDLPPTAR